MPNLTLRESTPERMDDPDLDTGEHHRALRGLARINRFSRSVSALWSAILPFVHETERPFRILDVATGAGDVPIGLVRRARRSGFALEATGCDISPTALAHATERASRVGVAVRFFQHDVLRAPLPRGYDAITCSLFLHHLSEDAVVAVLQRMKEATSTAIIVSDLLRSRSGYYLAWAGTRLLSRSTVVHFDGPVSVQAAFTLAEARSLAGQAGLSGARIVARWPFRFLLTWRRT